LDKRQLIFKIHGTIVILVIVANWRDKTPNQKRNRCH